MIKDLANHIANLRSEVIEPSTELLEFLKDDARERKVGIRNLLTDIRPLQPHFQDLRVWQELQGRILSDGTDMSQALLTLLLMTKSHERNDPQVFENQQDLRHLMQQIRGWKSDYYTVQKELNLQAIQRWIARGQELHKQYSRLFGQWQADKGLPKPVNSVIQAIVELLSDAKLKDQSRMLESAWVTGKAPPNEIFDAVADRDPAAEVDQEMADSDEDYDNDIPVGEGGGGYEDSDADDD